jgi:hypothetical protein
MCLLLARRHEEQHVQQGDRLARRQFGAAQITVRSSMLACNARRAMAVRAVCRSMPIRLKPCRGGGHSGCYSPLAYSLRALSSRANRIPWPQPKSSKRARARQDARLKQFQIKQIEFQLPTHELPTEDTGVKISACGVIDELPR